MKYADLNILDKDSGPALPYSQHETKSKFDFNFVRFDIKEFRPRRQRTNFPCGMHYFRNLFSRGLLSCIHLLYERSGLFSAPVSE